MGEVYLGLQEGAGGLERFVVIKRIDPEYVKDENFTSMLLEEARLAASIRHPNVVQILDIGHSVDGYFIVMEYLSGETLLYLTRTLHVRGERMPPSIACRIVAEIAAGLHCAHTATDPDGNPQPIVHRDVTPSNLIVCFNGVVKIVDFGVAKATLLDGETRGGVKANVKGKMSYLAPEQLYDKPIDGRADVFQLGICLHEFLTGTRLFRAETDEKRVLAVLQQPIPAPSEIVPSLPKQLDDVVLWALERDPEQRPETADDFRRALELAVEDVGSVSGADLGGWMRSAFAERLRERSRFERQCVAEMRAGRTQSGEMPATRAASGSDVDTGDRSGSGRFGVSTSGFSLPDSASFARTTGELRRVRAVAAARRDPVDAGRAEPEPAEPLAVRRRLGALGERIRRDVELRRARPARGGGRVRHRLRHQRETPVGGAASAGPGSDSAGCQRSRRPRRGQPPRRALQRDRRRLRPLRQRGRAPSRSRSPSSRRVQPSSSTASMSRAGRSGPRFRWTGRATS